jgi:hypothetical protein
VDVGEIVFYPELSQAKMAASLWYQPSSHFCFWKKTKGEKKMAGVTRLELATSCVTVLPLVKLI